MKLKDYENKLLYWQIAVEGIDVMPLPENGYEANNKTKKAERLTTFVREYAEKVINRQVTGVEQFEFSDSFPEVNGQTHENWWKQATMLGRGKLSDDIDLPSIKKKTVEAKDRKAVMDAFFPLYRALTERFNRRPFWHWITRHDEYVAERESINALKGVMMSLFKEPSGYVDKWYKAYCDSATLFAYDHKARKRFIEAARKDNTRNVFEIIDEDIQGKAMLNLKKRDEEGNKILNEFENNYVLEQNKEEVFIDDDTLDFNPEDITSKDYEKPMSTDDIKELNDIFGNVDIPSGNDNIILDDDDEANRTLINCLELAENTDNHEKLPPILEEEDSLSVSKNPLI